MHFTIRLKLVACLSGLALALLTIGLTGYAGMSLMSANTRSIVLDRLHPIVTLTNVRKSYLSVKGGVAEVLSGFVTMQEGAEAAGSDLAAARDGWQEYSTSVMAPDEAEIVAEATPALSAAQASLQRLVDILHAEDATALVLFHDEELSQTINPVVTQMTGLIQFQEAAAGDEYATAEKTGAMFNMAMAFVGITSFAVVIAAVFVVLGGVVSPMARIEATMRRLAKGELSIDVPFLGKRDEIGAMATAVQVFKAAGIENARLSEAAERSRAEMDEHRSATEQLRDANEAERLELATQQATAIDALGIGLAKLSQGDLTESIGAPFAGDLDRLRVAYNTALRKFSDIVGKLRATSSALRSATGEILAGSNDLADRTTRQAAAIEETSAAMSQLASTVEHNSGRAASASASAQSLAATATATGEVIQRSNAAMERIAASSSKISNIVGLINDIAFQTNLLALNASVEAARAGDAGKGFAVVAVEVRRLAQSAANASSEIRSLIEQSAQDVADGSKLVADAEAKITSMLEDVRDSAAQIEGISVASEEQSSAIVQVTAAVQQMDEMTQHNAGLVEETNAAIEQTEGQAGELDTIVDIFVLSAPSGTGRRAVRGADAIIQSRRSA